MGALIPNGKVCPDGRLLLPLLRVVLHCSVSHKGRHKITHALYHSAKKASRNQMTNNSRILKRFHVKVDKSGRKQTGTCKKEAGPTAAPTYSAYHIPAAMSTAFCAYRTISAFYKKRKWWFRTISHVAFSKNCGNINIQRGDTNDLLTSGSFP